MSPLRACRGKTSLASCLRKKLKDSLPPALPTIKVPGRPEARGGEAQRSAMKTVLFCGGLGTRIRDYSENIPKPMIPIGGKPILWHLMSYYSQYGHNDFILCLGYKANVIKEFFLNYQPRHNYRMRGIAEIVAGVVSGCRIESGADAGPDKRSYRVSFEKIARACRLSSRSRTRLGAEQLDAAYRMAGLLLEEFEGPRYLRIAHVQRLMAEGILAPDLRHRRRLAREPRPQAPSENQ